MSAAEIVATLFFGEMRFDPKNPQNPDNDRFVLSKGHAAPILYAAWAHAGLFPRDELLKLRRIDSDLEGHPTPRLSFVDVATGSLGQGICAAVGTALNARRIGSDYRTYVLLGDGEMAEGSVWEAADVALYHKLDNLCGIVDVNALGQSRHTQFDHQMDEIAARWNAFGWHTLIVDGHDVEALLHAFAAARAAKDNPTMILARTLKGKGVASVEGKDGWHGKAFKKGEEADKAIAELRDAARRRARSNPAIPPPASKPREATTPDYSKMPAPSYKPGEQVATREAWGTALAALGAVDRRVVALDADVKNSTFSDRFEKAFPDRFYENFIAEQVMVGAAMGLAARGAIAVPVDVRVLPHARLRLHPHGGAVERPPSAQRQADRLARRRLDRRGRPVADGARGSRDDARRARLRGALSVRRRQHRAAGRRDGGVSRAGLHAHVAAEDATSSTASTSSSRSAARRCCARARPTSRRSSAPASPSSRRARPTSS